MKKGIVVLLIALALLVIVAPGIVGMLAEKSVDDQMQWAEAENQDLMITAEKFDRGWFSSQGRHRIAFRDDAGAIAVKEMLGLRDDEAFPAILVDTTLNHGPIALASAGSPGGSLKPGLGNAVSTLSVETPDGEIIELPGAVYSSLGLTGDLNSTYTAEAGSTDSGSWSDININFQSEAISGDYSYDGAIESLRFGDGDDGLSLADLSFSGDLTRSPFGFAVGDMSLEVDEMQVEPAGQPGFAMGPFLFATRSAMDGSRVNMENTVSMSIAEVPALGPMRLDMLVDVNGVDGAALQGFIQKLQVVQSTGNTAAATDAIETELLDLLAAGADIHVRQLDVELPQGTVKSQMNLAIKESDRDSFEWTSLLLATQADVKLEVPEMIANMAMMMAPQPDLIQGFLVRNGDVYELEAEYKQGIMTVNGMPLAIPVQ